VGSLRDPPRRRMTPCDGRKVMRRPSEADDHLTWSPEEDCSERVASAPEEQRALASLPWRSSASVLMSPPARAGSPSPQTSSVRVRATPLRRRAPGDKDLVVGVG